jgi:ABC-type multidrug transport system ATPase subunit
MFDYRRWDHLLQLMQEGVTILITTHYIEEARQADYVGLMRGGQLLAEAPPNDLLRTYNKQTLEEVFLDLCRRQPTIDGATVSYASLASADTERTPLLQNVSSHESINAKLEADREAGSSFLPSFSRAELPSFTNSWTLAGKTITRLR